MHVVVLRGISGSGKSSYAREHYPTYEIVSADSFRYDETGVYHFDPKKSSSDHEACFNQFIQLLDEGRDVVVDNTNTLYSYYERYIVSGFKRGAKIEVVTLHCDPQIAVQRNLHGTPKETIGRQYQSLQEDTDTLLQLEKMGVISARDVTTWGGV